MRRDDLISGDFGGVVGDPQAAFDPPEGTEDLAHLVLDRLEPAPVFVNARGEPAALLFDAVAEPAPHEASRGEHDGDDEPGGGQGDGQRGGGAHGSILPARAVRRTPVDGVAPRLEDRLGLSADLSVCVMM